MTKNYDQLVEINHNPNWYYISDQVIDKIHLYVKDPFQSKDQLLSNGRRKVRTKKLKNPKAFIDYLQTIDDKIEQNKA